MDTKPIWQSKTIGLNVLVPAVLGVLNLVAPSEAVKLNTWLGCHMEAVASLWGLANVGLRLITKGAVTLAP